MKMPPRAKIPEAYSAIADQRVEMNEGRAEVRSSDGRKAYVVEWSGDLYSANDNATYWQGYAGYPVIAALLLQGRLPYHPEDALHFRGINWNELNKAHKNNYASALKEVLERLKKQGIDVERLNQNMELIYQALAGLNLKIKRGRLKPGSA